MRKPNPKLDAVRALDKRLEQLRIRLSLEQNTGKAESLMRKLARAMAQLVRLKKKE